MMRKIGEVICAALILAVGLGCGGGGPPVIDPRFALPQDNYDQRPEGVEVDTVVLHFISAINIKPQAPYNLDAILSIFRGEHAPGAEKVSSHYLIHREGQVFRLVPEDARAWHAGPSRMPPPDQREGVNDFSIGIELVGSVLEPFTDEQYRAMVALIVDIKSRHPKIALERVVGHDTIRGEWNRAHPDRPASEKNDPGPYLDGERVLKKLRRRGVR
jgi:AmpD protein